MPSPPVPSTTASGTGTSRRTGVLLAALAALLGQPEAAGYQPPEAWFDLVHEDDLPRLQDAIGPT